MTIMPAADLRGSNILANSACPGWVRTELGGNQAPLSTEQGADTPRLAGNFAKRGAVRRLFSRPATDSLVER